MLVSLTKVLRVAQAKRFAVGAYNTSNLETTQAIIRAAEAMHAPVIVQTSEKAIAYAGMKQIVAIVTALAEDSPIPVVLHLDHGRTHKTIYAAIESGYTSVMFDGSHLDYDENVRWTQTIVERAHANGVSVEAELGRVGGREDYVSATEGLTDPRQALEFARRTKCDALAIGIGNNHGKPRRGEYLHFDVLEHIAKIVTTPLVLHGASSTPDSDITRAIALGITKINIDTDLRLAFTRAERETLKDRALYDPRDVLAPATEAMEEVVRRKIKLFGSAMTAKYIT